MQNANKKKTVPMGIGMNIDQAQIDDIDDMQSPPNSPGLVLPNTVPSTNDKIDFFALDSSSNDKLQSTNENQNESDGMNNDNVHTATTTPSTPLSHSSLGIKHVSGKKTIEKDNSDNDIDLPLNITTSSDSYYSRSRRGNNTEMLNIPRQSDRFRRVSDVSDKSMRSDFYGSSGSGDTGSANGSFFSESETELYGSPIQKYVNRRSMSRSNNRDELTPLKSLINDTPSKHFDDGIVYRALSEVSDSVSSTPRSGSRSSSRSRRESSQTREGKEGEKYGDTSTTSQIFKNMLILEESLRQQYVQQQNLKFKYTMFLSIVLLLFSYSTYMVLFYPVVNDVNGVNLENNHLGLDNSLIDNAIIQSDLGYDFNQMNSPGFPAMSKMEDSNNRVDANCKTGGDGGDSNSDSNLVEGEKDDGSEIKYTFMDIIHRVFSIITLMTMILFYLTGEYRRTISVPRKFLVTTNKGIRQLNVRLVKVKIPFKERILGQFKSAKQHSGVDHVRLVLNPRVFSTATREQWELYRNQFWGLESVRNGVYMKRREKI